jgi:hypothetical protein
MARTFSLYSVLASAADFETLATQALPLKQHGNVEITIATQAERTLADIPKGGSPWHDYTSYLPTLHKFFPAKAIAPFLDGGHVERNRALLKESVGILRKHGYTAAFFAHLPFYMPEGFFEAYPHLRGARCDHPRRSTQAEFAICPDHPESQAMITEMMAGLTREVPELSWFRMATNDAGAGFCWSDWIYPGPNGPRHCQGISTAQRVRHLYEALKAGAKTTGPLDYYMHGNFSDSELKGIIAEMKGEPFAPRLHRGKGIGGAVTVGSVIDNPVRGIVDPVGILKDLNGLRNLPSGRINLIFRFNYSRGRELTETSGKVIELVDAFLKAPAYGSVDRMLFLRQICGQWVGEAHRDELLEALVALHEALAMRQIVAPRFTGNYVGVSMRHINRPLVILPELLSPEEEAYFLPHVFNPDVNEARTDYIDWHGGKLAGGPVDEQNVNHNPRLAMIDLFCDRLQKIAGTLSSLGTSEGAAFFGRMGISLKLYACVMRSVNNFFSAGTIRDRNKEKLSGPAHVPPKLGDWQGDPDLQLLNALMRDELDNTAEMLQLLRNGGMERMLVAERAGDEDTFLLGPDLVGNLQQKMRIMTRHWLDAQAYMSTPHK